MSRPLEHNRLPSFLLALRDAEGGLQGGAATYGNDEPVI